jgi:hypothetical protein
MLQVAYANLGPPQSSQRTSNAQTSIFDQQQKDSAGILNNGIIALDAALQVSSRQLCALICNITNIQNNTLGNTTNLIKDAALGTIMLVQLSFNSLLASVKDISIEFNMKGIIETVAAVTKLPPKIMGVTALLISVNTDVSKLEVSLGLNQTTTSLLSGIVSNLTATGKSLADNLIALPRPVAPTSLVNLLSNTSLTTLTNFLSNLTLAVLETPKAIQNITNNLQNPFCQINKFILQLNTSSSNSTPVTVILNNIPNLIFLATQSAQLQTKDLVQTAVNQSLNIVESVVAVANKTVNDLQAHGTATGNLFIILLLMPIQQISVKLNTEFTTLTGGITFAFNYLYSSASGILERNSKEIGRTAAKLIEQFINLKQPCNKTVTCASQFFNATLLDIQNATNQLKNCYNQTTVVGVQLSASLDVLGNKLNTGLEQFNSRSRSISWDNVTRAIAILQSIAFNLPSTSFNSEFQMKLAPITTDTLKSIEVCANTVQENAKVKFDAIQLAYNKCLSA